MNSKQADRVANLKKVNSVIAYRSEWKISPEISNEAQIDARITVLKGKQSVVSGRLGISKLHVKQSHEPYIFTKIPKSDINKISLDENIIFIEEVKPITTYNTKAGEIVKASTPGGAWTNGLTGHGQIIGVMDSGLDTGTISTLHPDLRDRLQVTPIAYARPEWSDLSGHGTHVAGSIVGTGVQSNGAHKGVAPAAKLVFQSVGIDSGSGLQIPFPFTDALAESVSHGATIHTNSWGSGSSYSQLSQETDQYTFANKSFSVLFAAGNGGPSAKSVGDPGVAKNVITVGATQNNRPDVVGPWPANNPLLVADFSARGQTEDDRVKPDVVAPGTLVLSTRSSLAPQGKYKPELDAYYAYSSGTSMATPIVTGSTALVRQYYTTTKQIVPSSALLKATLINGAEDIGYGWMSRETGWGRIDLQNTLFPTGGRKNLFFDDSQKTVGTGQQSNYQFHAKSGQILKFTLVWTDSPSALYVGRNLVNDLDLQVVAPDGSAYKGNCFASNTASTSCTAFDRLNNVENVYFQAPVEGTYSVRIAGYNVPYGPQPYSLVVSGNDVTVGSSAPTVNLSKFNGIDNFYLQGGPGAISLPNANVKAYPWSDLNGNGNVELIELGAAYNLGISLPNGSIDGTGLTSLGVGTHQFVITASNEHGESAKSTPFTLILTKGFIPKVPNVPTKPESSIQSNTVSLKWDPVHEAASYEVKVSETSEGPYATLASGITTNQFSYALPPNPKKSYYYVIRAVSNGGISANSPETALRVPSNFWLKASPGNGSIELNWTRAVPILSNYINYYIYRKVNGVTTLIATRITDAFIDTQVTNGTEYQYQLVAKDYRSPNELSTPSNWVTVTPSSSSPEDFAVTFKPTDSQVELYWTASAGAGKYAIIRNGQSIHSNITGTSFTDTNLVNGTIYTYEVVAYNTTTNANRRSDAVSVTPHLSEPQSFILTVTPEQGQLRLNWSTSILASNYDIQRSLTYNGTFSTIATAVTGTTYADTTGTSGGRYYYRIIARNASGSAVSNLDNAVFGGTATTIPAAPTAVVALPGNASVQLSWSAAAGASTYTVKRGTATSGPFAPVAVNLTTTSFNDVSLTNGTTYYYVITASNGAGESPNSTVFQATPIAVPLAPTSVVATPGDGSIQISWDAVIGATSYTVKRGLTAGGPFTTVASNLVATNYLNTGLTNATTYYYVINASNGSGESPNSAVVLATPVTSIPIPPAPTGVIATSGDTSIQLSWAAASGADSYTVKRGLAIGGPFTAVSSNITTTSYNNTGLTNGTTYYYVVTSNNVAGESTNSTVVHAIPVASPATGIPGTPTLSHTNQTNAKNYTIKWNIWWGNNGSSWKLYENNAVIYTAALTDNSPQAQTASYAFTNKATGTYTYKVEVTNRFGTTSSSNVTVTVN
nr:S8 family serine peptidase [Paenibacillus sp. GSMTC-2017]